MKIELIDEIKSIIERENLVFYNTRFTKLDNNEVFEVIIDNRRNNISVDEITLMTSLISKLLDEHEKDMPKNYYLQIISPGSKRNLYDLNHYGLSLNKELKIKFLESNSKTKTIVGRLININPIIIRDSDNIEVQIKFEDIKEGRWNENE